MQSRRDGTARMRDVTRSVLKNIVHKKKAKEDKIKRAWYKAAGKTSRRHTQPTSLKRKKLLVNTDSSGRLYELTMKKHKIISRLKKELGSADIEKIQLRIGEIERQGRVNGKRKR